MIISIPQQVQRGLTPGNTPSLLAEGEVTIGQSQELKTSMYPKGKLRSDASCADLGARLRGKKSEAAKASEEGGGLVPTAGGPGAERPGAEGGAQSASARPRPAAAPSPARAPRRGGALPVRVSGTRGGVRGPRVRAAVGGEGRRGRASVSDSGRGRGPEMVVVAAAAAALPT